MVVQKNGELIIKAEDLIDEAVRKGYLQGFQEGRKDAENREEKAYQRGLDDAWDAVFNFLNMSEKNKLKTFGTPFIGTFITCQSATEAIAKIKKYEQEHAPGCDNCKHKDDQFSVCGGCEDGSEYEAEPEQEPEGYKVPRTIWLESSPIVKTWETKSTQEPEPSLDEAMSLDEAITHCEEVADGHDRIKQIKAVTLEECKCAAEHRQLASWLRELKERRAKE